MPLRKGAKKPWTLKGRRDRARVRRHELALMTPEEQAKERFRIASQPPPRKECPVCLRTLMTEAQEKVGHHQYCARNIDAVLRKVLDETEELSYYIVPPAVDKAREQLAEAKQRSEAAGEAARQAARDAYRALGDFRKICLKFKVCMDCGLLPSLPSNLCRACEATWRQRFAEER